MSDASAPVINSTHERILQCALKLFAERGFHGTGIRDIAAKAGISTANLYHYGSKEKLLAQIMTSALTRLLSAAHIIRDRVEDPDQRLDALVRMHVITHALSPEASSVVDDQVGALDEKSRAEVVSLRDRYESFYADVVTQGVASGQYSVPDVSAARLGILEMCSGVARWFSPSGRFSALQVADIHVDLVRSLLQAGPSSTPGTPTWLIDTINDIWTLTLPTPEIA
ncbi:MAG: TetR family transcriptional regulator [Pontimonas sp.]|nr:TetR family transcriptional regulator [Pontimonas sp.]